MGNKEDQKRGQGESPCDEYLSVASVAKTTFRYKEVHLNEVYGCAYTPYLGYQKLRTERKT